MHYILTENCLHAQILFLKYFFSCLKYYISACEDVCSYTVYPMYGVLENCENCNGVLVWNITMLLDWQNQMVEIELSLSFFKQLYCISQKFKDSEF